MLFSRGSRAFSGWFATHPPLDERIQALDPGFRPGDYTVVTEAYTTADDERDVLIHGLVDSPPVGDVDILETAGQPASHDVAESLRVAIPGELYHAAHSRESSLLLIVALALSVVVLNEVLTPPLMLAAAAIVAGIYLARRR